MWLDAQVRTVKVCGKESNDFKCVVNLRDKTCSRRKFQSYVNNQTQFYQMRLFFLEGTGGAEAPTEILLKW
jgi:hypothetical protein